MIDNSELNEGNPAERALNFIESFKRVKTKVEGGGAKSSDVQLILAVIYNLEYNDISSLQRAVANLWSIPSQMRQELAQIHGLDQEPYLQAVAALERAMVSLNLDAAAYQFSGKADDNLVLGLRMLSALLKKDVPYPQLPVERRVELAKDLNKIIDDIGKQTDLDGQFKIFAIEKLQAIVMALQQYDILGSSDIIEKVDNMVGGVIRHRPSITQSELKRSIVKRMLKAGAAVLMALNIGNGVLDVGQKVVDFIDTGSSETQVPLEDQLLDDPSTVEPPDAHTA